MENMDMDMFTGIEKVSVFPAQSEPNEQLDFTTIVDNITATLSELDGEEIVELYNTLMLRKIKYIKDSIWEYDENENTIKDVGPDGKTEYDVYGSKIKKVLPDGTIYLWEYDKKGNLIKKVHPNGDTWIWEYDSNGNLIKRVEPNDQTWIWEYDSNGNLTKAVSPMKI